MFELLGIALLLAVLLAINSLASFATAGLWRLIEKPTRSWRAATRARTVFLLRSIPAVIALLFVFLLLVPAYLAHEPRRTAEAVSYKLALLALLSAVGIGLALFRGIATWRATRRLRDDWLVHAQAIEIAGINIPSYCLDHAFPVIAIVGVLRPRLFIATQLLGLLTPDELAAAVAHEHGHLTSRDNLKRGLLRACRDVLVMVPSGRSLDRTWSESSEVAADDHAASRGQASALNLASALVKIARATPAGGRPAMPAGVFLVGENEPSSIKLRVRRLIGLAGSNGRIQAPDSTVFNCFAFGLVISLSVFLALTMEFSSLLATVHTLIEGLVAFLK